MTFPTIQALAVDKLGLLLEQLPDWHLGRVHRNTMRAFRCQAAGEILAGMPFPALPRPPQPTTKAEL
jgi:hypothetical protein